RHFYTQLHADGVVRMNVRNKVNIYANINVLKLRVDDRTGAAGHGERTRGDGNAVPNAKPRGFAIAHADLRVLDDLGPAITKQRCNGRVGYGQVEIACGYLV